MSFGTPRFEVGQQVGDYRLVRRIAFGGMAEVWGATAENEGRVALKLMRAVDEQDDEAEAIFLDEARLGSRLKHDNVVQVMEGFREGAWMVLVMEWVDGDDLRRLLRTAERQGVRLEVPLALAIGRGMARGLAYVHSRTDARGRPLHIIHRDVSPANVVVTVAGRPKILDFGIAHARRRTAQTAAGIVKGKAAYMSPEQAMGQAIDHRSDIFSLGVVLWEVLRGRRLFSEASPYDVLEARVPEVPVEGLPKEIDDLLSRMLAARASRRPETMVDVERGLTRALLRHFEPEEYDPAAVAAWVRARTHAKPAGGTAVLGIPAAKTEPDGGRPSAGASGRTPAE